MSDLIAAIREAMCVPESQARDWADGDYDHYGLNIAGRALLAHIAADRKLLALHAPGPVGRACPAQCGYCANLCQSDSGLSCDRPDAPFPCDNVVILAEAYGIEVTKR
jgi:hypothetical protein